MSQTPPIRRRDLYRIPKHTRHNDNSERELMLFFMCFGALLGLSVTLISFGKVFREGLSALDDWVVLFVAPLFTFGACLQVLIQMFEMPIMPYQSRLNVGTQRIDTYQMNRLLHWEHQQSYALKDFDAVYVKRTTAKKIVLFFLHYEEDDLEGIFLRGVDWQPDVCVAILSDTEAGFAKQTHREAERLAHLTQLPLLEIT